MHPHVLPCDCFGARTDMRTVKWDDQHAIKVKVELRNATTGKREAAVTHTFVAIGGDGLFLGAQQRIGNSSKEAKNIWGAFVTKELKSVIMPMMPAALL